MNEKPPKPIRTPEQIEKILELEKSYGMTEAEVVKEFKYVYTIKTGDSEIKMNGLEFYNKMIKNSMSVIYDSVNASQKIEYEPELSFEKLDSLKNNPWVIAQHLRDFRNSLKKIT